VGKTGLSLSGNDGGGTQLRVTSGGAAITGTLSATGNISSGVGLSGASGRHVVDMLQGGYSVPGNYNTAANGDKFIAYLGDSYDARIGVGTSADMWFKSAGNAAASFGFYTGATTLTKRVDISSTGLAVTGTLSSTAASNIFTFVNSTAGSATNKISFGVTTNEYSFINYSDTTGYLSIGQPSGRSYGVNIQTNGANVGVFSAAGLAVTGLISATTEFHAVSPTNTGSASFRSAFTTCGVDLANSTDTSGVAFINFRKADSTAIGSINRVALTNAVVYNTTSDARLKENLRDFTDSGRLIDALKPRVFDWKGDTDGNGKDVIGFVAQEEHAADPIFAHIGAISVGDNDPTTITKQWQRSDAALIPILVAELQSLRKRLAALEAK
jgi:hypothetical protein